MRKQTKPAPAPELSDVAKLAAVVEGLTHQVQHLAMILDEVREDLVWAVRNDKFTCPNYSQQYVASQTAPVPEAENEERQNEGEDDDEQHTDQPPTPNTPPRRTLFE